MRAKRRIELEAFDPRLHSERLLGWLRQPQVARWWGDPQAAMDHAAQSAPEAQALIVADGAPVGYLCWQELARQELEAAGLADLPEGLVDIDVLIGEPELLGQGIGSQAVRLLLARLRQESSASLAGLGTAVSNVRAMRAFERAGFRMFRDFHDPEWGPCRYFVAEVRGAGQAGLEADEEEPAGAAMGAQGRPACAGPGAAAILPRSTTGRTSAMSDRNQSILYSGGHKGAEAEFGRAAEKWGVRQVTLSYDGHVMEYSKHVEVLSPAELLKGDVSMEIVSKRMGRTYTSIEQVRTVCQLIFHMVSRSYAVFAVGWIQGDDTVQGGTGWGVELAKFFGRPVSVFDQARHGWFTWKDAHWAPDTPVIPERPFAATGTRNLSDEGRAAIGALFERSFGPAK